MLLIDGQTGEYAYSLPMVVIILLLSSWFLSMYMTPAMCFWKLATVRAMKLVSAPMATPMTPIATTTPVHFKIRFNARAFRRRR